MILLHGGLGSGEMFGPTLPALAERHQVIVVDLGHGRRTADIDRPIDIRPMAGDIAALIDHSGWSRTSSAIQRRLRTLHRGEVSGEGGQARQRLGCPA